MNANIENHHHILMKDKKCVRDMKNFHKQRFISDIRTTYCIGNYQSIDNKL